MIDYALQTIEAAFPDLQQMIPAQWVHTGDSDIASAPNWILYRQMESHGGLILVVAKERDHPVGYMAAFLYPHPNAFHVNIAEIKTYYVEKGRSIVLKSMADFLLQELAKRGVYKVKAWTNADASAARLWHLFGFETSDIGLTLKLKKPAEAQNA